LKANQFCRKENDDEAVSPVIAVILMVAITVVLAATVYVWVSGFGASSSQAQRSVSLTSAGPLSNGWKNFTVASASQSIKYSEIALSVNGQAWPLDAGASCAMPTLAAGKYGVCQGGTALTTATAIVKAGDVVMLGGVAAGQQLRLVDANANSVMLTLTIG
jgi:flagellin-like protein